MKSKIMKKTQYSLRSHRGLVILTCLAGVVILTVAAGLILGVSGSSPKQRQQDLLTTAKVAFADRELSRAENLLRTLLSSDPKNTNAQLLLARVLLERGHPIEAQKMFAAIWKDDPKNIEATRGLAESYDALGQDDTALVYWRTLVGLQKDDASAWRDLGLALHGNGDSLEAMSAIQKSLALDPEQPSLSKLMTEMAVGKGAGNGHGRFEPLNTHPLDPRSLIPKPEIPDPRGRETWPGRKVR